MDNISLIRMEDGTLEDIKSVLVMFTEQVIFFCNMPRTF